MPAVLQSSLVWLVVATGIAYASVGWAARRTGADREALDSLVTDIALWALLGSRLIYAISDPYATLHQPARLLLLNGVLAARGAAAGGALAVLYHAVRRRRFHLGTTRDGAALVLAAAGPALMLAWGPDGLAVPSTLAPLGPLHPVAFYYATIHVIVTAVLWLWPERSLARYVAMLGAMFVIVENFRQAPLVGGLATALQLVGAVALILGLAFWSTKRS